MAGYNCPDNVSASDPDAPWNQPDPQSGECTCGEITDNWTGEAWFCRECEDKRREDE